MHTVMKQMRTETAHRLMDYDGKCAHLHGHSYLWQVTATSHKLTHNGLVLDFKDLKKAMEEVLEPLDHALVLSDKDPLSFPGGDGQVITQATDGSDQRIHVMPWNPTAENFAEWASSEIQLRLPTDIKITKVTVYETETCCAEWTL
jgi:6-pyruvoyltetrahydropterin/6-carboxytetrahydropterin synthase